MRNDVGSVSETIKKTVAFAAKSRIGAENKFTAAEITDNCVFQRFQGGLFVLVSGENIKGFRFESPDKARIQDKSSAYSGRSGKDAVD